MIRVQNLSKSFNGQKILTDVNIDIFDNESLVILGPSGHGKTIFIKLLNRLIASDSGSIEYDGLDITKISKSRFNDFRKQIAFVFQNCALFDFLDIKDNLSLFLTMHNGHTESLKNEKISQTLSFVGLDEDILYKFPAELSGGMKKRVAIARAMIQEPKYIFYDEPTTGLDNVNAEKVSVLIKMLQKEISATSIIVTHDIKLMRDVADRVALLNKGKFTFIDKSEKLNDSMLDYLYNGEIYEL